MGLLTVLTHMYKPQYFAFVLLQILDIVSHWVQMYRFVSRAARRCRGTPSPSHHVPFNRCSASSLLDGAGSHKVSASDKEANPLLRFYYSFPYALFFLCMFNEGFLVGLYTLKFTYVTGPA